jgi:hypothetical protein
MPERSNGAVSKTVVLSDRDRGFESPFLRSNQSHPRTHPVKHLIYRMFYFPPAATQAQKRTIPGVLIGGDKVFHSNSTDVPVSP